MLLGFSCLHITRLQRVHLCKWHFPQSAVLELILGVLGPREGSSVSWGRSSTEPVAVRGVSWGCLWHTAQLPLLCPCLLGLSVSKNVNSRKICFVILTLAFATVNFSSVSGSFFLVLYWEVQEALKHIEGLTPDIPHQTDHMVGVGRWVWEYLITTRANLFPACCCSLVSF